MIGSIQYTCTVYTTGFGRVYTVYYTCTVYNLLRRVWQGLYSTQKGMTESIQYAWTVYTTGYDRVLTVYMYSVHSRV